MEDLDKYSMNYIKTSANEILKGKLPSAFQIFRQGHNDLNLISDGTGNTNMNLNTFRSFIYASLKAMVTAAVEQWVIALAPQAEGCVSESQPRQT